MSTTGFSTGARGLPPPPRSSLASGLCLSFSIRSTASSARSSPVHACAAARSRVPRPAALGIVASISAAANEAALSVRNRASASLFSRRALSSSLNPASSTARRPARPPVSSASSVASWRRRAMGPGSGGASSDSPSRVGLASSRFGIGACVFSVSFVGDAGILSSRDVLMSRPARVNGCVLRRNRADRLVRRSSRHWRQIGGTEAILYRRTAGKDNH